MDIIKDYFGTVNEAIIKEQYVIVYEVRSYHLILVLSNISLSTCGY